VTDTGTQMLQNLFRRRVDAWLAADLDAYMACWTDDMVIELPSGVIEGAARYRKLVAAGFSWATPLSFDVHHLAFEDNAPVALADWTIRARRREDNALVEWRGLSVCEFADDKIRWWREHHLAPPAPVTE
jgi:ketosteroid isomerase-like protein